jgi:hypothetical protein
MGRKPKNIWLWNNGTLFIRSKYCGIPFLILCADSFTLYQFEGKKDMYLKAEDCLNWFKQELEYGRKYRYIEGSLKKYKRFIDLYSKAIAGTLGRDNQSDLST